MATKSLCVELFHCHGNLTEALPPTWGIIGQHGIWHMPIECILFCFVFFGTVSSGGIQIVVMVVMKLVHLHNASIVDHFFCFCKFESEIIKKKPQHDFGN